MNVGIIKSRQTVVILIAMVLSTLAVLVMSYLVQATTPDADGKINACYLTSGGELRVIDTANDTCSQNETALSWDQQPQIPVSAGRVEAGTLITSSLKNITSWSEGSDYAATTGYGRGYCLELPFTPYIGVGRGENNSDASGNILYKNNFGNFDTYMDPNAPESMCPDTKYNVYLRLDSIPSFAFKIQ
jgi:hypothetical protein